MAVNAYQDLATLVVVWMGNCVETQLDDLLAEGGDGVVEPVPLVHHPLGSEAGLHMGEPPGSVVCPERRQRNRPLVVRRHCRVKNVEKSCVSSKSGSPLLRRRGREWGEMYCKYVLDDK